MSGSDYTKNRINNDLGPVVTSQKLFDTLMTFQSNIVFYSHKCFIIHPSFRVLIKARCFFSVYLKIYMHTDVAYTNVLFSSEVKESVTSQIISQNVFIKSINKVCYCLNH